MPENPESDDPLTDEDKRMLFDNVIEKKAERLGVNPNLLNAKISLGAKSNKTAKEQFELAKALGFQLATEKLRNDFMASVHTAQDVEDFKKNFNEQQRIPTIARKVLEYIKSTIPRMGGPGRSSLLNAEERKLACDKISDEIRKGAGFKQAIQFVSQQCPNLFAKSVSTRTLENIWRDRSKT
jgi:hypothetical protein